MSLLLEIVFSVGLALSQTGAPSALSAEEQAADKIEQKYGMFADIAMDFTQEYLQKARGRTTREVGRLYAKRPQMLRFDYSQPRQKFFVSDGQVAYFYMVDDAQVIRDKNFSQNKLNSALGFLWGESKLRQTFKVGACQAMPAICPSGRTCECLELVPLTPMPEVEAMRLVTDKETLLVHGAVMDDAVGNQTTYVFNNVKTDSQLGAEWFKFQVPEGVTVLEQGSK